MTSLKQLKLAQRLALQQQEVVNDLNNLIQDIDRAERSINSLKVELEGVNQKYQGPRDTRQDVDYLTALLACAKKKLVWERHMASLQKRTPEILSRLTSLINDPQAPADESMRATLLQALQGVQAAMERLQSAKS
ncbi:MAG TPA: hypothetical protein VEH27_12690 [Methylomirabilota bacterium]|nr:hypothetical protein [Methylomirabilota bacterium]